MNGSLKDFWLLTTVTCVKALFRQSPGETVRLRQTSNKVGTLEALLLPIYTWLNYEF